MEENQAHIPDGWENKSLIQLADYINGYGFKPDDWSKEGIPIIRIEQLKNPNTEYDYCNFTIPEKNTINEGDLIFSWSASLFLKIWDRQEAALNQHLFKVIPFGGVDKLFLKYLLDSSILDLMKNAQGSTMQHITRKELHSFHRFLPKSKTEQTQIATILSKVDEAITKTEQLIAKYTRIKTGLMQDLLTKGIDENGNIRSEETHEFKDSALGRIPKEWEVKKLGDLMFAVDPQPDHRTPSAVTDGVPYVGISDFLENGEIDLKSCRKVGFNVLEKQQRLFKVELGDLIFGKIGTIGKPTVLPNFSNHHFTLSANIILIKPHESPDFIYWSLISNYVEDQVQLAIHSTSQPAFGMQKIRDINILTPLPAERERITSKLNKLNEGVISEKIKYKKLQSLKTGLMQDLLSGKVRVNHLIKETASV